MRRLESISSGVSDNNEETRDKPKPESSSAEENNYGTSGVGPFAELMTQRGRQYSDNQQPSDEPSSEK